jgi:arabinose-5-phosphate isomerase
LIDSEAAMAGDPRMAPGPSAALAPSKQGHLVGIVTDGDLRRHMGGDLLGRRVSEIMTASPRTIRAGALAAEALHVMNERSITSLFVIEDGRPVGIVRMHDCLRSGVA